MMVEHAAEAVETTQFEVIVDDFHVLIDRAVMAGAAGRWERAGAFLAAARRVLASIPDEILDEFELTGHLDGVTRSLLAGPIRQSATA